MTKSSKRNADWMPPHYVSMCQAVRDGEFGFLFNGLNDFSIVTMLDPVLDIYLAHIKKELNLKGTHD